MIDNTAETVLQLFRKAVDNSCQMELSGNIDWSGVIALASRQGVVALCLEAVEFLPAKVIPKQFLLQWIGLAEMQRNQYEQAWRVACKLDKLWATNGGNKRLAEFERVLQALTKQNNEDVIEGTHLYRPPVLVTALFLIEHAYSHFLHEGLTWRHVLDWMMFSRKHQNDFLWTDFEVLVEEYGFKKFYDSFNRLGKYLLGEINDSNLSKVDKKMLADVWAHLDLHETVRGVKGKLALAGNTWRARWKYHYFADISMLHALWIQVKGFLFIKDPKLQ